MDNVADDEISKTVETIKEREKICISITEGYIRHHNEEPEIEEQFVLRLPEDQSIILHEALATDNLDKRLKIKMKDNLHEAEVQLDDTLMYGKLMELPTIIESYKMVGESTTYKTADVAQILVCEKMEEAPSTSAGLVEHFQEKLKRKKFNKLPDGITPPMKNVRKKRFRKVKLEENFNPNVDREVKRLLRADGAAEHVRFELIYEDKLEEPNISETVENIDKESNFNDDLELSEITTFNFDSDSDTEFGGLEDYDFDTLTEEQKELHARLSEINFSLSNLTCKASPPTSRKTRPRGRGRGRGRGRPRLHPAQDAQDPPKTPTERITIAGRGKRGRPPGRGRGITRGSRGMKRVANQTLSC